MATSYFEVFDAFLSKIQDYSYLQISDQDMEQELLSYLKSSTSQFDVCKKDLSKRSDFVREFEEDLNDTEIDILANLMVVSYLKPKVLTSKNLEMTMSDQDFKIFSQANHIRELLTLYKEMKAEVDKVMTKYTYRRADLSEMK
ncbi:hypothetical protein M5X17_27430 [Paenibacillus alvei]|uniref:hypothetical protein n=1 Tax=Paenibacillus alvei TaxID=44250 RepID=UPI00228145D6|nr:hypothetical protein [Paenibacillus alvei]MCY9737437.1 hypothetical protein [Paenibacillus alvei]